MSATNETNVLKLPQFVGTDKPSWLGDMNGAFLKIDTTVGENIGKITEVETVANAAQAKAESANGAVTGLGSEVSRLATEVDAQASEIDALQSDVEELMNAGTVGFAKLNTTYYRVGYNIPSNVSKIYGYLFDTHKIAVIDGLFQTTTAYTFAHFTIGSNTIYLSQFGAIPGNPFNITPSSLPAIGNVLNLNVMGFDILQTADGSSANIVAGLNYVNRAGLLMAYIPSLGCTIVFCKSDTQRAKDFVEAGYMAVGITDNLGMYDYTLDKMPWAINQ